MNVFIRLGQWWESRRVLRKPDWDDLVNICEAYSHEVREKQSSHAAETIELFRQLNKRLDGERAETDDKFISFSKSLEKARAENQLQQAAKEIALITTRLDRLELFVGLKRDPKPAEVPGAARIG